MSNANHDVAPCLYATVIREMIRHENDVTNHRIMWLLILQGLIANACVTAGRESRETVSVFAVVGILVTFSAFILLYKSYQARGYLLFLGVEAKQGALREVNLPLFGWPEKRIKGWQQKAWLCPWLGHASDLLEPYLFLPNLLIFAWLFVILRLWLKLGTGTLLVLSSILAAVMFSVLCIAWVRFQRKDEREDAPCSPN